MKKTIAKATPQKLALKKKTVAVLSDRSIIANLNNTKRPVIIISMGCGSDFTRYIPANIKRLMTDITKPGK
jgi:hypothetical protein